MIKSFKTGGQNKEAAAVSERVYSAGGAGGDQGRKDDRVIKRGVRSAQQYDHQMEKTAARECGRDFRAKKRP